MFIKFCFKFILILFYFCGYSQENNLNELRKSYLIAGNGKKNVEQLLLLSNTDNTPIFKAYKAAANMMMIEYTNNVYEKYKIFKINSNILDELIINNSNNLEIKLLRYCIHYKSPKFIQNKIKMKSDLDFIMENIDKQDVIFTKYINQILVDINYKIQN